MAAAPARRRSRSPRASASRRRSASASSLGSPDGFDGTSPAHFSCSCAAAGTVVRGARRPGLPQVLGGVDPQLLFAQRQQDEGAEQLRVVDAGDGIACRRQGDVADHGFVEAVIAALCDQAVGDLALRGETRASAAAGGDQQRDGGGGASPLWRGRAPSRRGSSQARRHHQDRRPCQAQHLVGRRSRLRREQAGTAADAHDEQAVRLLRGEGWRARAPARPATPPCVRPAPAPGFLARSSPAPRRRARCAAPGARRRAQPIGPGRAPRARHGPASAGRRRARPGQRPPARSPPSRR